MKQPRDNLFDRLHNAYNMGLLGPEALELLRDWVNFVMRFEGGQINSIADFFARETKRTRGWSRTLANDTDGYKLVQLTAILCHPCQKCAVDPNAWHTRYAFCEHQKTSEIV
jgi:hypothetical protein